jgi:predicted ATPase
MLTRLKIDGFKNLVDVDVSFGPFTGVAGANGVGKSNLFDAITFLSALADRSLMDAALSVRSEGGKAADVRNLFHRIGDSYTDRMTFEAEMLVPPKGVDDLGQEAKATTTFLRYRLTLAYRTASMDAEAGALRILKEELEHITQGEARAHLPFPHKPEFRRSVVTGRRTSPFMTTEADHGTTYIKLRQDRPQDERGAGGRPRHHLAEKLPRTVLSSTTAAESRTALLARREMQSWRLLQLEPSALRTPDAYNAPPRIDSHGAHMAATLARLTRLHRGHMARLAPFAEDERLGLARENREASAMRARIGNRLAELIDGVREVRVDADDRRELFTLLVTDSARTPYEARALSDGTLRFLALSILESDPEAQGLLCLEEPENGIHPARIPAMLKLLQDLAVDPEHEVGPDNPLRQVIINTHSPSVVAQIRDDSLLIARMEKAERDGHRFAKTTFRWLDKTWRSSVDPTARTAARGELAAYLNPLGGTESDKRGEDDEASEAKRYETSRGQRHRVMDRKDLLQMSLFAGADGAAPQRRQ